MSTSLTAMPPPRWISCLDRVRHFRAVSSDLMFTNEFQGKKRLAGTAGAILKKLRWPTRPTFGWTPTGRHESGSKVMPDRPPIRPPKSKHGFLYGLARAVCCSCSLRRIQFRAKNRPSFFKKPEWLSTSSWVFDTFAPLVVRFPARFRR